MGKGREVTSTGLSSLPMAPKSRATFFRVMKHRAGNGLSQLSDASRDRVARQSWPRAFDSPTQPPPAKNLPKEIRFPDYSHQL